MLVGESNVGLYPPLTGSDILGISSLVGGGYRRTLMQGNEPSLNSTIKGPDYEPGLAGELRQTEGPAGSSPDRDLLPPYDAESKPSERTEPAPSPVKQRKLVPHILVFFDGVKDSGLDEVQAWGRDGVAGMGYAGFTNALFQAYICHSGSAPPRRGLFRKNRERKAFWKKHYCLKRHFDANHRLLGTFARDSGGLDAAGPVRLQAGGWPEMVKNVVEIHVKYELPAGMSFKKREVN